MRLIVVAGLAPAMPDGTLSFIRQQSPQAAKKAFATALGNPARRLPFSHGCDTLLNGIIGFINKALI